MPPQFDLDAVLDDSYDDTESTRDTVRQAPLRQPASSRYDERDHGAASHGANSQNSGRACVLTCYLIVNYSITSNLNIWIMVVLYQCGEYINEMLLFFIPLLMNLVVFYVSIILHK